MIEPFDIEKAWSCRRIDIRDLRVGDWVKIKDLKDPIKRISCIDEYLGTVDFWDGEKLFVTSINNVLPIPLTEEIVEDRSCPQVSIYWDDRKTEETGEKLV